MAISQMSVRYRIPNISNLVILDLPAVIVHGIEWNAIVFKNKEYETLSVFIHCGSQDNTADWSYAAQYSIKLISTKDNSAKEELYSTPFVFGPTSMNCETRSVIKWTNLLDAKNYYVENDTINLDIDIKVVDPNDPEKSRLIFEHRYKSCEENCRAIFELTIENVDRLLAVKTPEFNEKCMPWTLTVFKGGNDELMVRLHSKGIKSTRMVHIRLVPSLEGTDPNKKVETKCIQPSSNFETESLISWAELLKPENGFIKNNSITIDVEITSDGFNDCSKEFTRLVCAICFENLEDKDISSVVCGHQFCTTCIRQYVKAHGVCPSCQKLADLNDLRRMFLPIRVLADQTTFQYRSRHLNQQPETT